LGNILTQLKEAEQTYTKGEAKVAAFIAKNPDQSAILNLKQISAALGVGEATIVRLAKKLGFHGFQELRNELKNRLSDALTASARIEEACSKGTENQEYLHAFIDLQVGYIRKLEELVGSAEFQRLINLIIRSETLFLYEDGGASAAPGDTLAFWLTRFGHEVKRIAASGHRIFDAIVHHGQRDVLMAFCFTKDNPDLSKLLEYCKAAGIHSLVVADYTEGYTLSLADTVLTLERGPLELFHSMSVPVLFCESVVLSFVKQKGQDAFTLMRELETLRNTYRI